jgi:hypothetical protein
MDGLDLGQCEARPVEAHLHGMDDARTQYLVSRNRKLLAAAMDARAQCRDLDALVEAGMVRSISSASPIHGCIGELKGRQKQRG